MKEQCKRLDTRIFQLTFPVGATNFFFIISDMATFRQIMTDPTTEKPSRLYNKLNNISGSSTILTLNGEPWQSKRKAAAHAFSSRHIRRMSTVALVKSFDDGLAFGAPHDGNNIGAQRTGAVWAACDNLRKVLPRGNRAAMRRELMVWVRDCSESIEEFGGILELGPRDDTSGGEEEDCMIDEDQFTESEMDVARAAVNLMKCSKNVLALVLKACECAGEDVESFGATSKDGVEAAAEGNSSESDLQRKEETLQCISNLHELGRTVGEGVTNFGVLLYPPLDNSSSIEESIGDATKSLANVNVETDGVAVSTSPLSLQLERQLRAISECLGAIEELRSPITEEVRLAMERLEGALEVRREEIRKATTSWSEASNSQSSYDPNR